GGHEHGRRRGHSTTGGRGAVPRPAPLQPHRRCRPRGPGRAGARPGQRLQPAGDGELPGRPAGERLVRAGGAVRHPDRSGRGRLPRPVRGGAPGRGVADLLRSLPGGAAGQPQLLPLGRVRAVQLADDRAHRPAHRDLRRGRADRDLRGERLDDPVRLAAGEVPPARRRRLAAVRLRLPGRDRAVAVRRALHPRPRRRQRRGAAGVRVRDHRVAVPAVQRLRRQPVAAVPPGRPVGRLPGRRARVHHPEPGGEVGAGLAGVRRHARRV
ncbi:MAG: Heliorhodopsin, partial [uncultured Corynebacteriales bacterium]